MPARDSAHVEEFRKSLKDWVDERFISRNDLEALAMYHMYIVNLGDDQGWLYDGESYKPGRVMGRLVVKSWVQEEPFVCFISGRTYVNCVRIFLRRLAEGTAEWVPDKYRA